MAYISPAFVVAVNPVSPNGTQDIVVEFRGDAGEDPRQFNYQLDESSTNPVVRRWVFERLQLLNSRKTNVGTATVGQTIPQLAPPSDPVPTAFEIWATKARRLIRSKEIGLTNVTALADISALEADVNNTHQAGYVGQL